MLIGSAIYKSDPGDFDITLPCDDIGVEEMHIKCVDIDTGKRIVIRPRTKTFVILDTDGVEKTCRKFYFQVPFANAKVSVPLNYTGQLLGWLLRGLDLPTSDLFYHDVRYGCIRYNLSNARDKWVVVNLKPESVYSYDLEEYRPLYNTWPSLLCEKTLMGMCETLGKVEFYSRMGISTHPPIGEDRYQRSLPYGFLPPKFSRKYLFRRLSGASGCAEHLAGIRRDLFVEYVADLELQYDCDLYLMCASRGDHLHFAKIHTDTFQVLGRLCVPLPGVLLV